MGCGRRPVQIVSQASARGWHSAWDSNTAGFGCQGWQSPSLRSGSFHNLENSPECCQEFQNGILAFATLLSCIERLGASECIFTHLVMSLGCGVWLDSAHLPSQVCYSEFFPFRHEPDAIAPLPLVVRKLTGMQQLVA